MQQHCKQDAASLRLQEQNHVNGADLPDTSGLSNTATAEAQAVNLSKTVLVCNPVSINAVLCVLICNWSQMPCTSCDRDVTEPSALHLILSEMPECYLVTCQVLRHLPSAKGNSTSHPVLLQVATVSESMEPIMNMANAGCASANVPVQSLPRPLQFR